MSLPFRFLDESAVRAVLSASEYPALVDLMEVTLRDFTIGRVTQPVRTAVPVGPPGQYLGVMPARLAGTAGPGALGGKLVSVVPGNAARGLSTHLGIIALFAPETGALVAVLDARYITEVRTAAVSAVSVRCMARPEASRLAIIGTGVQARSHLDVIASVRRLAEVRAWGPDAAQLATYAREMSPHVGLDVQAALSAEQAVRGADLVVLATSSERPVLSDAWVSDGAHVVSVGACRPDQREIDPAFVARARVVVDSRAAALVESGDILGGIAASHVVGELGEVAAGRVTGRAHSNEVTLFKSLGLAAEDVATAALVRERAERAGLGIELAL
jgi:ornithine cyclodeaminase/alanine dehydrogenase-like protein (mu-crystallin family)